VRAALCLLLVLVPSLAAAKTSRDYSYAYAKTFPTALRLLKVDERVEIVERDAEAGYILFELTDDGKKWRGALELVPTKDSKDRDATRVLIEIQDRPDYLGDVILNRLGAKLRQEHGDPPSPPPAKKPEKAEKESPKE
jgi:hypothetical protein